MEICIDDVFAKSVDPQQHLANLKQALLRTRTHGLKSFSNGETRGANGSDSDGY